MRPWPRARRASWESASPAAGGAAPALRGADVVFHQAALRWTRCQEAPRECQEVMVDGTFNVLEAASIAKAKRVVLASSAVGYGEPPRLLFGDGAASADFVYVDDVAQANLLACETTATDVIVNVCSGVETRMRDLAALLLELTGSGVGIAHQPQPPGQPPQRRYRGP